MVEYRLADTHFCPHPACGMRWLWTTERGPICRGGYDANGVHYPHEPTQTLMLPLGEVMVPVAQ